jgi:cytochrome c-type biogenesis protein CcmH/NrfG
MMSRRNRIVNPDPSSLRATPRRPAASATGVQAMALVWATAGALFGVMAGFVIAQQGAPTRAAVAPASQTAAAPASGVVLNEAEVQALKRVLESDPKNVGAATKLGHLYYDAGQFADAVPYYRQVLAITPDDVNVRTDLGTALFYSGNPDAALAEYDKSLAQRPTHPNTLFNIGIVKLEGKSDPKGAIATWEKLLSSNPAYPDRAKVESLIARAKSQTGN